MVRFRDLAIRQKLMLFILAVCCLTLLAGTFAVIGYENSIFKRRALRELQARAEMIANSTAASLHFDDPKTASALLQTLKSSPDIIAACIYGKDTKVFAFYERPGLNPVRFPTPRINFYEFRHQQLRLFREIDFDQEKIGTVFLQYDLKHATAQIRSEALIFSIAILGLVALAFLLSIILQRTISTPIMKLAIAAKAITTQGDYSVRVAKETNDEIGQLTDAFNQMLDIIAARRDALNRANVELARELAERNQAQAALQESQVQLKHLNLELENRVTERTAKLEETIGELRHISYSLTHDMRAPLRAMHSFAELLLDENRDQLNEMGRKYLRQILASSTRLDHLIQDAFDYSLVAGAPMKLQPVDTAALLHGMMESYPQFQQPKADVHLEGVLPVVLGNEALLTQCFSNLLNNAVKFTSSGTTPRVNVRTETRSSVVRFWVEDQGIGIPKPAQERIFGMFQRAHVGYDGTGIGLAIVRKAVERMGGRVGVESEPGQGSRFWVELRPANGESEPPPEQQFVA